MQFNKKARRLKRAKKARIRIRNSGKLKLVVNKTNKNLYAQVIDSRNAASDIVISSASTLDKEFKKLSEGSSNTNAESAAKLGKLVAERALKHDVKQVAFDRSGFKYHGCIKALADAAREAGLEF